MSREEQFFCCIIGGVFEIPENRCGSVEDAIKRIRIKSKSFGLPFRVLKEKASGIEVDFITEFVKLLNPEQGTNISTVSGNICKLVGSDEAFAGKLKALIKPENFDSAMISYLTVFEEPETAEFYKRIPINCFVMSKQDYPAKIDKIANDYKSNLDKTQLLELWKEKTRTPNPYQWATHYQMPLLVCRRISGMTTNAHSSQSISRTSKTARLSLHCNF
jgi:hypothetical protein